MPEIIKNIEVHSDLGPFFWRISYLKEEGVTVQSICIEEDGNRKIEAEWLLCDEDARAIASAILELT